MRRPLAAFLILFAVSTFAEDQRLLTLDDIHRVNFSGNALGGLTWIDGEHYLQQKGALHKVHAATGKSEPFYNAAKMASAFEKLPGIDAKTAKEIAARSGRFNPDRSGVLVSHHGNGYVYYFGADASIQLAESMSGVENQSFSPDGNQISFVKNSNLHVVDIRSKEVRALTADGSPTLLNGKLDWVYQEEVYGRGDFKSYWWSPDSKRIAFLQLDESPVKPFTVVDHIPNEQKVELEHYPQSGRPNPAVKLGVSEVCCSRTVWISLSKYTNDEPIVARVGWTPDSSKVLFYVCNREQTWMDLNVADPCTGSTETLFRETTGAWVETDHLETPVWLKDGTFLFLSERDGYRHIYQYTSGGKLIRQVTSGQWEVRKLHGVDETNGWLYFSGTVHSPIGSDAYRIKFDGSGLQRLTQIEGTHHVNFDPKFNYYVDTWSDASTPPQTRLYRTDGSLVRVLEENKVDILKKYRLSKPEFLQVKTRDGFIMEAMLIKPPDFDPAKKYPVWSYTYSGPHNQSVHNAWNGGQGMWHQFLAQKGYMIWVCDNRSASGKGAVSAWSSYKKMGVQELQDLEDGVSYLKSLPYVDGSRIGINGWSFGGFMTSYALTHSKSFKVGIAGGSVTDWNLYDTIYTERYMLTPQHNPDGYAQTSVLKAAKNLSGKLLLIHGTIDDNVHMQNTLQFVYELQKSGKQFDLMLYPKSRHGVGDPDQVKHMRELMTKYILDNL